MNIVGRKYQNLMTGNTYQCTGQDGNLLTLETKTRPDKLAALLPYSLMQRSHKTLDKPSILW